MIENNELFEVAVIGAGPGGYETAIRLNQKGIKTVLWEKYKLGGECLNWGCIPTKAMVKSAELYSETNHLAEFGIDVENVSLNFARLMARKEEVVSKLIGGLEYIFSKRKIPVVFEDVVKVSKDEEAGQFIIESDKGTVCAAKYVVVATGSKPMELPNLPFDGEYLLSSRDILGLKELPAHLTIIGGGTIGCEFASIFSSLGAKVEIVELLPALLAFEDKEIARKLTMSFKKKGIIIHTGNKVESATVEAGQVKVMTDTGKTIMTDKVLISTGRVPCCDIEFDKLTIERERGKIIIDELMETGEKNLFAIGDLTGKLMLAHTASKQGLMTAAIIEARINNTGEKEDNLIYCNIPRCTFTDPELASVGLTEEQAAEKYGDITVGKFLYSANGKALAIGCKDGYIKVIATKKESKVVGMHIIGSVATELIALGSIIINTGLTLKDLHKVVYAHPTVSEVVMEAFEDLEKIAIHKI